MDKYQIPHYLDEPMKFFLLTIDEMVLFVVPFLLCLWLFDQMLIGIFLGATGIFGLKRLKGEQGHYFIYALMYWHLPAVVRFKCTPPSFKRQWRG